MFWVISVYFNIRNTLPKFCPFLLGHPLHCTVYINPLYVDLNPIFHLLALLGAHHILHVSGLSVKEKVTVIIDPSRHFSDTNKSHQT